MARCQSKWATVVVAAKNLAQSFHGKIIRIEAIIYGRFVKSSTYTLRLHYVLETDRNSVSVTISAPKLPISWFRPGFGYGRSSHFGFGLVSVTAVTRNLVSA